MKLAAWLERLPPDASHWGLVDKHRAQYFIFTALLLMGFSAGSLLLWLMQSSESIFISAGWLVLLAVAGSSILLLYRVKSIPVATNVLLIGHFIVYNLLVMMTGFHQSPMILNLFYIPLIALLPGESRMAIVWSLSSVVAVAVQYLLSFVPISETYILVEAHAGLNHWFHWNLMGCVLLSGLLALAYDKTVRDMTAILAQEKKQFEKDLLTDDLTGVANQLHLERYLDATIYHSSKLNQMIGVVNVSIDGFQQLIDRYGRHTSDQVLQLLAARIQNCVRGSDLVARMKDDQFVLVLPNIKQHRNLQLVVDKVSRQLHEPLVTRKHELTLNFHVQQAVYPEHGESAEAVLAYFSQQLEPEITELDYV